MPSKNPLEIPEITDIVASYLCNNDLARCLRVSKSWRDIFLPCRWRVIHIEFSGFNHPLKYYKGPDEEVLHKHRNLVQDLSVEGYFNAYKLCDHPNLLNLRIYYGEGHSLDDRGTIEWNLTEMFPLLCHLSVTYFHVEPLFCEALSKHPNIRSLHLDDVSIKADVAPTFWEACANLESLKASGFHFLDESFSGPGNLFIPAPENVVLNRLRRLNMSGAGWCFQKELDTIVRCPKLESFELNWKAFRIQILINHPVRIYHRPQASHQMEPVTDTELVSAMEGIRNCFGSITHFYQRCGSFGPQVFEALGFHFSTLVKLDLPHRRHRQSYPIPSTGILDVLCSCPKLEILRAPFIYVRDIAEGEPWICQQPQELKICFSVGDAEQDLQRLVFERLSTLIRLEALDMGVIRGYDDDVLEFRLDCGLGQLGSLQEMTTLRFYGTGYLVKRTQRLGIEDVEWMVSNWKKLKYVTGHLSRDQSVDEQLKGVLKSHRINAVEKYFYRALP
ncbi:hypothetical protein BGX34_005665 [Mortierella sp. NVP85]|nr:hypothetical protein BGX34_005665 [Mortierella sp. NVP85]